MVEKLDVLVCINIENEKDDFPPGLEMSISR